MAINVATGSGFSAVVPHEWDGSAFRPLAEGWQWNGTDWGPLFTAWSDSGLDKSGTQSAPAREWVTVTGWAVRDGYPSTKIEGAGVRVPPGQYRVHVHLVWSSASYIQAGGRLVLDGQVVPDTEQTATISGHVREAELEVDLAGGLLELQEFVGGIGAKNITEATYWTIEAV